MEDICGTQRRLKGSELKLCKGQDLEFIVKAQRVGRRDDVKVQERVLADAEGLSWGNCSCTHNMYGWLSECLERPAAVAQNNLAQQRKQPS